MEEDDLDIQIELLKMELYELFESSGSFVDPEVVELSQLIDRLIVQIQRLR